MAKHITIRYQFIEGPNFNKGVEFLNGLGYNQLKSAVKTRALKLIIDHEKSNFWIVSDDIFNRTKKMVLSMSGSEFTPLNI